MKTVVPLLVGLLIIYLVFFKGQDGEPTQEDIQSLESIRDENGNLVEVPRARGSPSPPSADGGAHSCGALSLAPSPCRIREWHRAIRS